MGQYIKTETFVSTSTAADYARVTEVIEQIGDFLCGNAEKGVTGVLGGCTQSFDDITVSSTATKQLRINFTGNDKTSFVIKPANNYQVCAFLCNSTLNANNNTVNLMFGSSVGIVAANVACVRNNDGDFICSIKAYNAIHSLAQPCLMRLKAYNPATNEEITVLGFLGKIGSSPLNLLYAVNSGSTFITVEEKNLAHYTLLADTGYDIMLPVSLYGSPYVLKNVYQFTNHGGLTDTVVTDGAHKYVVLKMFDNVYWALKVE